LGYHADVLTGTSDRAATRNILGKPSRGDSFKMLAIEKLLADSQNSKKVANVTPSSSPTR
jgi:hypothetical protein